MKIEIPEFEVFPDSNISGKMIVNPFWLEHLLNLFYQGYVGEVWEEVMDTEMNHCALIENWGYGIIGQEFDKKHLDLSNSIAPRSNSPTASADAEDLIGIKRKPRKVSQIPNGTSLNSDIHRLRPNLKKCSHDKK